MAHSLEIFTVNFLSLNFVSQRRRADRLAGLGVQLFTRALESMMAA
jgi:hypothetical protein